MNQKSISQEEQNVLQEFPKYRVGICGSMSVGKSTLVKALLELDEFKNYTGCVERSKYLRDLGIPLNIDSSIKGQLIFMAERARELFHDNLITDRTIWDVCAFTHNADSIEHHQKVLLTASAMLLADEYDVVFYISPEGVDIEDNGIRTTDSEYRDKIDLTIKELLRLYKPKRLIELKGSTEERIKVILDEIGEYL
jgi:nicotinamide riboside kinase